ncbi:hypothetical protein CU254_42055 (plasmid) [Amycolatopsis sp. AA4]|uniref:hypothetical protein n=1 Tax=Actinomycetes TaxID=1760 RepID=UPI0001B56C0A|nr:MULTISPECIES: hypothetical protein [Actinomycetes]ATY17164.1 hypothetical protein CU254_42055 [Amycolatopsis sp. AA4]EFL12606.1 hypothetical protein SSMG_08277 [Streptomyces sp. AA4]
MIDEPSPTSGNAAAAGSGPAPPADGLLDGPGVPPEEAGTGQCEACGRVLPRAAEGGGQPQRFCHAEHTLWRVPDRKGGTKRMRCREVAAAWQVEAATRGRADAPGPPIDLHGLAEQVASFGTRAAEVLAPLGALAGQADRIQEALAGDVAAARREVEAMRARVREMEGQVSVAQAAARTAEQEAQKARERAAAATSKAEQAERIAAQATRERDQAQGQLDAERKRRETAEELRAAALTAKDLAEQENARLAAAVEQQTQRLEELQTGVRDTARAHSEEIGRLHQQHAEALAAAQADHDRTLAERIDRERTRLDQELQRATAEHAAERNRLTAELDAARRSAAADAREQAETIGALNRELGAATVRAAAAETDRENAAAALAGLRTGLEELISDIAVPRPETSQPADVADGTRAWFADQLARLLDTP